MAIAVDSSVLLDVLLLDPVNGDNSRAALNNHSEFGLIVSEAALAEVTPALETGAIEEFLADWKIAFSASTLASAALAGRMYAQYLKRAGAASRVVPDFLIGAHAQLHATALITRDAGYYRDYFEKLQIINPSQSIS
jgi:predicted nucleic acid-binding protein